MLVGISGRIGSGKDTLGKLIQVIDKQNKGTKYYTGGKEATSITEMLESHSRWGYHLEDGWIIKKYAGKLKQIASILTGIPVHKFEDQEFKETYLGDEWNTPTEELYSDGTVATIDNKPMKVRTFLQLLGTEGMRFGLHKDTWINALFSDYTPVQEVRADGPISYLAETDRYPNWVVTDVRFPNEAETIKDRGGLMIRINRELPWHSNHESEVALDDYKFDYVIDNNGTIEDLAIRVKGLLMILKSKHGYTG